MQRVGNLTLLRMFLPFLGRLPIDHVRYMWGLFANERPHRHGGQIRVNSFFPPFPSPAWTRFCRAVIQRQRAPYSLYLATTSSCPAACEHCSYARRAAASLDKEVALRVVWEAKQIGTITLGFTGGEPLMVPHLEELIAAARPELATIIFTGGYGLDAARALSLASAGIDCVTVGFESADACEHDRVRKRAGSFDVSAAAVEACRGAGIYTAMSTVATRERLQRGELEALWRLGAAWGVGELRVLSPVATGGWTGAAGNALDAEELATVRRFHVEHNRASDGPVVAAFAYLESNELYGCGAGFHHAYVDAAGNVSPCDLTPFSFGNVNDEPLTEIWQRMGERFPLPRCGCLMKEVAGSLTAGQSLPVDLPKSRATIPAYDPVGPLPGCMRRLFVSEQESIRERQPRR